LLLALYYIYIIKELMIPIKPEICKVNLSGFSLDNYKTFNPDGYSILCRLGETCDGISYFPKSAKIIIDSNQQSQLINQFDTFIPSVAEDWGISVLEAWDKSLAFFDDKTLVVQRSTGYSLQTSKKCTKYHSNDLRERSCRRNEDNRCNWFSTN